MFLCEIIRRCFSNCYFLQFSTENNKKDKNDLFTDLNITLHKNRQIIELKQNMIDIKIRFMFSFKIFTNSSSSFRSKSRIARARFRFPRDMDA